MSPGSRSSAASSAAGIGTGNGLAFGFLGYALHALRPTWSRGVEGVLNLLVL